MKTGKSTKSTKPTKTIKTKTDYDFLTKLSENKISWTFDDLIKVRYYFLRGLTQYIADTHSGMWHLTEEGKKFLANQRKGEKE